LDSFSIRLAGAQIETTQKKVGSNRAGQAQIKIEKKQEIHRIDIAQGKFPSISRRSNKSNEASRLLLSCALRPFRSCRSVKLIDWRGQGLVFNYQRWRAAGKEEIGLDSKTVTARAVTKASAR
jgi:hypothetical protein